MPSTTAPPEIELIIEDIGGGGGGGKPPAGGDDGGDNGPGGSGGNKRRPSIPPSPRRYYTGMALGIVSILMFFMALASAFLVRRGTSLDWVPVHLPPVLLVNTLILLASSATLELARRRLTHSDLSGFRALWSVTTALGLLFLIGQFIAWRQLVAAGVFIASNPASSFFYIFTGLHGLHLFGGVAALCYVSFRKFELTKVSRSVAAEVTSYYWHFMDALWVFLLALLYLGK
jgi:cytochrome c oxidase subunit III